MLMRAITTTAVVRPDHTLTVQIPADIPPGQIQVVVVLPEDATRPQPGQSVTDWPAHDVGLVDPTMTFRREDIYGDDGR
jgi:hypothetical protein